MYLRYRIYMQGQECTKVGWKRADRCWAFRRKVTKGRIYSYVFVSCCFCFSRDKEAAGLWRQAQQAIMAAASAKSWRQQKDDKDEVLHAKIPTFGSRQSQAIFWKEQYLHNPNYVQIFRGAKIFHALLILKPVIFTYGVCVCRFLLTCLLSLLF